MKLFLALTIGSWTATLALAQPQFLTPAHELNWTLSPADQAQLTIETEWIKANAEALTKAAEDGNAHAQFYLAFCYERGMKVERSRERAMRWMNKAAEQGLAVAEYGMGFLNEFDDVREGVITGNYPVAAEWYERAAMKDHTKAQFRLGVLYHYGKIGYDRTKAAGWYRKAAAKGYLEAIMELAQLLQNNPSSFPNGPQEAAKWYQMATKREHPEALYRLGMLYCEGKGVKLDWAEGIRLLRISAKLGNEDAVRAVASIDLRKSPVKNGPSRVAELTRAAELGAVDAILELAAAYEKGINTARDPAKALDWYLEASQTLAGREGAIRMLFLNRSLIKSVPDAVPRIVWVVNGQGAITNADALYQWGELQLSGQVETADPRHGIWMLTDAALAGSADALTRMGELWDSDLTGNHDPAEAFRWFRLAAIKGHVEGQFQLGKAFLNGSGIEPNLVESWRWLTLSSEQGQADAQKAVALLTPKLSAEELKKAQTLVDSFRRHQLHPDRKATP